MPDIFVEFDDRATKMGTATPNGPKGARHTARWISPGSDFGGAARDRDGWAAVPMTPEDLMQAVETAR